SNLREVEFSVKVLDALGELQKMARPENWEVLRPYAEKLLGEAIPPTHDDAVISSYRSRLKTLFASSRDEATRLVSKAKSLFECLKQANPYEQEVQQVATLYGADLSTGNDINLALHALKEAFAYKAFDDNSPSQAEVDDLANRLKNYRDIQTLLKFETELRAGQAYVSHMLPNTKSLKDVREQQTEVADKLAKLQSYLDSEVRLVTELVGQTPSAAGESDTINSLIRAYTEVYATMHDTVVGKLDDHRQNIETLPTSKDFTALQVLEGISALKPAVSHTLDFAQFVARLHACPQPSRHSVEAQLINSPVHECGLTFENFQAHLDTAAGIETEVKELLDIALNKKVEVFLNAAVRTRLEQGKQEKVIAEILKHTTLPELRAYFVSVASPELVQTINRYLKNIVTKTVKLADFKPSIATVEPDQVKQVADELGKFLNDQIKEISGDKDTLPMLHLE
ncbi:MAG: DUF6079 family protein, partial [bacterium]